MTEQPTGDYRLIPWAYPPIPGGSTGGGGGGNAPYDFSQIRAIIDDTNQYRPHINQVSDPVTTSYKLIAQFMISDVIVLDASEVDLMELWFQTTNAVDSAGENITARARTVTISRNSVFTQTGYNFQLEIPISTAATGNLEAFAGNWKLTCYNEAGDALQQVEGSVSI